MLVGARRFAINVIFADGLEIGRHVHRAQPARHDDVIVVVECVSSSDNPYNFENRGDLTESEPDVAKSAVKAPTTADLLFGSEVAPVN